MGVLKPVTGIEALRKFELGTFRLFTPPDLAWMNFGTFSRRILQQVSRPLNEPVYVKEICRSIDSTHEQALQALEHMVKRSDQVFTKFNTYDLVMYHRIYRRVMPAKMSWMQEAMFDLNVAIDELGRSRAEDQLLERYKHQLPACYVPLIKVIDDKTGEYTPVFSNMRMKYSLKLL
jgi:hypothetical protein